MLSPKPAPKTSEDAQEKISGGRKIKSGRPQAVGLKIYKDGTSAQSLS